MVARATWHIWPREIVARRPHLPADRRRVDNWPRFDLAPIHRKDECRGVLKR